VLFRSSDVKDAKKRKRTPLPKKEKKSKASPLFGPRSTNAEKKNPFFAFVDTTPEAVKSAMSKEGWLNVLHKTKLSASQFKQASYSIVSHFD